MQMLFNMIFSRFFKSDSKQEQASALVVAAPMSLKRQFIIPEPTKSLLWITSEDASRVSSPMSITLTISLSSSGVDTRIDDGHNFYGEPSLIWTRLPVEENDKIEQKPMYYPSYSGLSPTHRYQYLSWLRDITQPTNLSYVFLYYYGLERHLLVGDFEKAVLEILRLLQHHNRGTFRSYAQEALIVGALHRKRPDILEKYSFIEDCVSNETLLIRKALGKKIKPKELMEIASQVGFKNRRYIKLRSSDFERELQSLLIAYETEYGSLLDIVPSDDLRYEESSVFANVSLPVSVRTIKVPQLITNARFKSTALALLADAHENIKRKK